MTFWKSFIFPGFSYLPVVLISDIQTIWTQSHLDLDVQLSLEDSWLIYFLINTYKGGGNASVQLLSCSVPVFGNNLMIATFFPRKWKTWLLCSYLSFPTNVCLLPAIRLPVEECFSTFPLKVTLCCRKWWKIMGPKRTGGNMTLLSTCEGTITWKRGS